MQSFIGLNFIHSGELNIQSNVIYRKNVIEYPHILDWFFTERVSTFVKHWLYNTLTPEINFKTSAAGSDVGND